MNPVRSPGFFKRIILAACLLFACQKDENTGAGRLFPGWDGAELKFTRVVARPDAAQCAGEGFPDLQSIPLRLMESDSISAAPVLKLLEFQSEVESYSAFQSLADRHELEDGFARRGEWALFRKGRWMGRLSAPPDSGLNWLASHLSIPGKSGWGAIPEAFASMLHQGRIRASERVFSKRFLGVSNATPVFAVEMDCRGDTATVYASPDFQMDFGKKTGAMGFRTDFQDGKVIVSNDSGNYGPVRMEIDSRGMVGVEGCFDSSLTERWLKTQKIALKSLKST